MESASSDLVELKSLCVRFIHRVQLRTVYSDSLYVSHRDRPIDQRHIGDRFIVFVRMSGSAATGHGRVFGAIGIQ